MNFIVSKCIKKIISFVVFCSFFISNFCPQVIKAQNEEESFKLKQPLTLSSNKTPDVSEKKEAVNVGEDFRVEKIRVAGGFEIITIFLSLNDFSGISSEKNEEIPLVSVLRDTLGDNIPENDRLRYVWMLTYTKPSLAQKLSSAIPFLYARVSNKSKIGDKPPPPILDLNPSEKNMWDKVFWIIFKNLVLSEFGTFTRASALQYKENKTDYRKAAVMRSLAVLSLYQSIQGEKLLSDADLKDIQARAMLTDNLTGSFVQSVNLNRVYQKNTETLRDNRGHNWELLRQYSERQGLYFEPIEMPDGSATHAIVWTTVSDLESNNGKKFDSRFLNIKNPWNDKRLTNWKGYTEDRWFDEESRIVAPGTPNAQRKTMIPLALYGLDFPKIPTILIDFRDTGNPKMREMSKRVLEDVTKNVLAISKFGNLPFFFGHFVYNFVTGRRGMDINQNSRFRSYSQLKLLLLLDESMDEEFKDEISDRLEKVSLNPRENDLDSEVKIARRQYENLIAYAKQPQGLAAKIDKDRREEMTRLKHGGKQRMMFAAAHLFSFGFYTHREKSTPELLAQMDIRRRLDFHERFLRETARDSSNPEIDSDVEAVKQSLDFIAEHGKDANSKTAQAVAKLFLISNDEDLRLLCLKSLDKIENTKAKKELLAFYENENLNSQWRNLCANYLKLEPIVEQRISSNNGAVKSENDAH